MEILECSNVTSNIMNLIVMFCVFWNRDDFDPRWILVNVWRHLGVNQKGGATGTSWVEMIDGIKHPSIHRVTPQTKH